MFVSLLLSLTFAASAAAPDLPERVDSECTRLPASAGLLHLRCGETRRLVIQPIPVDGTAHDEILDSLAPLVTGLVVRTEVNSPLDDPLLRRTILRQRRDDMPRGRLSVELSLTTDPSTGLSAACMYGLDGRRSTERREALWCNQMVREILPLRPSTSAAHTTIQVQVPNLPGEDL
ncbi:MAG: hypothetical protein ACI9MC_001317 [Kiritimatiellia bacterium]|jgi:hypothetical protein